MTTTTKNGKLRPAGDSGWLAGFDTAMDVIDQRLDGIPASERGAYLRGYFEGWDARTWQRTLPPRLLAAAYDARLYAARLLRRVADRIDTLDAPLSR
jgi:hypothetical protein